MKGTSYRNKLIITFLIADLIILLVIVQGYLFSNNQLVAENPVKYTQNYHIFMGVMLFIAIVFMSITTISFIRGFRIGFERVSKITHELIAGNLDVDMGEIKNDEFGRLILDYKKHDYATAAISHLPHMISFALANLVKLEDDSEETMKTIAAGGFRDMTRIAASSPIMWENICDSNTGSILSLMDLYIEQLLELRNHISNRDHQALLDYFQSAKDFRDSLTLPAKRNHSDLFEIFVDLIDEAGGIAIIASILASKGINIKNIGIINNREFEEGVLRIEFYNQESLDSASTILEKRNYSIHKR